MKSEKFLLKEETYKLIGICMEVHQLLGYGFSEVVYKDAIEVELLDRQIMQVREMQLSIMYKSAKLKHQFYVDFKCFDSVIIEVKTSGEGILPEHIAQLLNYLKVSGTEVGLLVNFGNELEYQRFIFTNH